MHLIQNQQVSFLAPAGCCQCPKTLLQNWLCSEKDQSTNYSEFAKSKYEKIQEKSLQIHFLRKQYTHYHFLEFIGLRSLGRSQIDFCA